MRAYHIRISLHNKVVLSSEGSNNGTRPDTFVPSAIFQALPSQPPKSTARKNALINSKRTDYRFGPVRIDWLDFDTMSHGAVVSRKEKEGPRSQTTAAFVQRAFKSGSTNLPEGVVHLFRDTGTLRETPGLEASTSTTSLTDWDGVTLGVLAVPSWMTPSDFLAFLAPAVDGVAHLRLIRDSVPNRSIAVIQFLKTSDASDFVEAYNGKPFNSMEPETCHIVRVLSVEIDDDEPVQSAISRLGVAQSTSFELPTCPVCLERMDSAVTGLITVPCSHTFHCMCLSKWGDSRCPVCRYSQTLLSSHPTSASARNGRPSAAGAFSDPFSPAQSSCVDCGSTSNLWICLICGNVGCGRYGRAHAHSHYEATTHLYALELETQRVWDYAGDGYVHRLIQNRADGKLVELPSASMRGAAEPGDGTGPGMADRLTAEKIEAIGIEYSYLLTSQLDSQRAYYEMQTAELQAQMGEMRMAAERTAQGAERQIASLREETSKKAEEERGLMEAATRDRVRAEKKAEKLTDLARKLEKELKEERAVSQGLMENLTKARERMEHADKEKAEFEAKIRELEDQVRDVMFYLEAKEKIDNAGGEGLVGEMQGGSVQVPASPPPKSSSSGKKKKIKK